MTKILHKKIMELIFAGLHEGIQQWERLKITPLESGHIPKNEQFMSSFIARRLNISLQHKDYLVTHETSDLVISEALGYENSLEYRYDLVLWKQADQGLLIDSIIEVKAPNKTAQPVVKDGVKIAEFLNCVEEVKHCYLAFLVRGEQDMRQQTLDKAVEKLETKIDSKKAVRLSDFKIKNHKMSMHGKCASAGVICISRK